MASLIRQKVYSRTQRLVLREHFLKKCYPKADPVQLYDKLKGEVALVGNFVKNATSDYLSLKGQTDEEKRDSFATLGAAGAYITRLTEAPYLYLVSLEGQEGPEEMGLGEFLIPVWGSGKQAIRNFEQGEIGWGLFNSVLAVSDVFLVKALVVGGAKLVVTGGAKATLGIGTNASGRAFSHNYGAAVSRWRKAGILPNGFKHHWLISQKLMARRPWLKPIGNQLWNLKVFRTQAAHMRWAHGHVYQGIGYSYWRLTYPVMATPTWFKASVVSGGGRLVSELQ